MAPLTTDDPMTVPISTDSTLSADFLSAFGAWNDAFLPRSATSSITFNAIEMDTVLHGLIASPLRVEFGRLLPPVEEMLEKAEFRSALGVIRMIADRVFGDAAGVPECSVDDDPVLGGLTLLARVPVSGIERDEYRSARRDFDEALLASLPAQVLGSMVITTRFDG